MSFNGEVRATLGWKWVEGATDDAKLNYSEIIANGNGANQAEAVWHEESQVLTSGSSTTLDLTALLRTVFGDTLTTTFLLVKAIMIVNESTSGGQLLVGGAASDEWSEPFGADGDKVRVPLDSPLLLTNRRCGWEVDNSNRNLKIAAAGGNVTYSIAIIGTLTVTTGECSSSGL